MKTPPALQQGSIIQILAPAKRIDAAAVYLTKEVLENAGFIVQISEHCLGKHHYFSGSFGERLSDLQEALKDPNIDAILCARGGYGCVHLVDELDWSYFQENPKWIVGFSDVTVLHSRIQSMGIASIHGTMPLNFKDHTQASRETLINAISGQPYSINVAPSKFNKLGFIEAPVMGGNLAIIASLLGTNDQPDYTNSILFIEEVGEPLYNLDRMFYSLKKAGVLNSIKGLIVGGMTSMKDSEIPFGDTLEEIIDQHVKDLGIPVAFNFPAGHLKDNRSVIFGNKASLTISDGGSLVNFH